MTNPRFVLAGVLVMSICVGAPEAHAWTEEEGRGIVIFGVSVKDFSERYDVDGRRRGGPRAGAFEISPYVAYGVTPWLTAIAQPRLNAAWSSERTTWGVTDSDLGARVRIWHETNAVLSFQGLLRTPAAPTRLGQRGFGADFRFIHARNMMFGEWPAFFVLEGGRRFFSDRPDEWRAELTLGLRPLPDLMFLAQSVNLAQHGAPGWRSLVQLSLVRDIAPGWSLQGGAWTTVAGRAYAAEVGGIIALWRRF